MQTFLGKTADHLFQAHGMEGLKEIAVVMPSQRGNLYLKRELAIRGDRPFLSPSFFTIEEFALQMTDSVLEDPIDLLFEAYACFQEVDSNVDFDRFVTWGQMMLKDFDTLDLYLVDPSALFTFLSEAKSIERWGKEYGEEQADTWITPNTQAYFKLYDSLLEVYIRLKSRLEVKGTTYRGLAYRKLVELLEAGKFLGFKQIYFVGFNALSKSEETIIRLLLRENVAQTLWDVDEYYIKNKYHRAGNWLRDYSNPANPAYLSRGAFHWMERDLLDTPKQVEIIGLANPSAQIFVALEQIRAWQAEHGDLEQVALVLGDESLLDSLMPYLGEFKDRLNVTMGYSLKKSQVFSLIELWWSFVPLEKYPISLVKSLKEHPLMSSIKVPTWKDSDLYLSQVPNGGNIFISAQSSFQECLQALIRLLTDIVYKTDKEEWNAESQAILQALTVLDKLEELASSHPFISIKSGQALCKQLLQLQKMTFEGAEHRSLHVMGLLETRTLDFDRVIVLSLNEGSLPGTRKRESLIPVDIANMSAFSLPTFTQADAVTSYHFYRLLQRPKEVVLVYVQNESSSAEVSRFIRQIRFDWAKTNPHLIINEPTIQFSADHQVEDEMELRIEKTPELIAQIKSVLENRGFSPSSVATFASCSLKYYFSQLVNLRQEKQRDDEIGSDVFGTWLHKVLELLDTMLIEAGGWEDHLSVLEKKALIEPLLAKAMAEIRDKEGNFEVEKGFNYVLQEVAKTLLGTYFDESASWNDELIKLLAVEQKIATTVMIPVGSEMWPVMLKGQIDRIDLQGGSVLRIVDYKTGKVEKKDVKAGESLTDTLQDADLKGKLFQLWMYKYLVTKELQKSPEERIEPLQGLELNRVTIQPGIISFRNFKDQLISSPLTFSEEESEIDFIRESESVIKHWVHQLVSPESTFEKTVNLDQCSLCDFTSICHRNV
ncbi:PD-(D/E)XK nuclease family protein [Aquirufa sp. HETE-83D]|uniref:PD-(D/E)XK nuclease family protein n=1 Tax=Aquirufa esocilacus TaxID=3096513 RepID=A0ABW6DHC3_9BACT